MEEQRSERSVDTEQDDELSLVDVEINPEGYGIEGKFEPVAVFDVGPADEKALPESAAAEDEEGGDEEGEDLDREDVGETMESEHVDEGEEEMTEGEEKETVEGEEEELEEEEQSVKEEQEGKEEEAESAKDEEEIKGGEEEVVKKELKIEAQEDEVDGKKSFKKEARRRMSIRKKSIFYPIQGRLRTIDELRVSGDFTVIQEDILGSVKSAPSIISFQPESGEYSYDEEMVEEEEAPLDRQYYYDMYKILVPERVLHRMKNNFLHRKMAEYFRKRKMEHVLKETDQQVDSQHKYEKKLDALADLKDLDARERNSITAELNDMRSQRNDQLSMLNNHFITMQNREREIGMGLINTKTGKEIPDKLVERFLKRQRDKWTEVAKMRLVYIKIRDRVAEKKTALRALDCIGDNLHLIDYEQLKIENQSHTDKIEEREEELTRLRVKCQSAMQCLAHVREKSAAMQIDIQSLTERYEDVAMEYIDCRERLNYFKQERDNYRIETDRLCEESGLLNKPKLLQNMEMALQEVESKSKQLEDLIAENQRLKYSVDAIKRNIRLAPVRTQAIKKLNTLKSDSTKIYRGRPTLIYPQLPKSDWSESTDIL